MPFTNKLKADYVEMINYELDRISIGRKDEFNFIALELEKIITPSFFWAIRSLFNAPPKYTLPQATLKQLADIRDCLNSPKDYVASSANYAEYQQILKDRIKSKIIELRTVPDKEKESYIGFKASETSPEDAKEKKEITSPSKTVHHRLC